MSSRPLGLFFFNTCVVVSGSFPLFSMVFSKIAFEQPIRFSWLVPDLVDNKASSFHSSSRMAPAASPTSRDNLVALTVAVFNLPALVSKFPPLVVAIASSALHMVASPVQAASSPTGSFFLPA